ncbi:MAG: sulfite exporter TauE/SafE family protein [Magnetococcales bacterium]|nr:sulfite exporter TauE/SafE family protein [Magnetococcales bacterium]
MNQTVNPEIMIHLRLLEGFESISLGVLIMGIFYGLTLCSFSCLPIIGPYIFGVQGGFKQGFSATAVFVAAKVVTYTLLGAISGSLGSVVLEKIPADQLLAGSGILIILVGLLAWQRRNSCHMNGGNEDMAACRPHTKRHMATLGFVTSLMPCLPLSAILLYSATSQSILTGASLAFLFGIGTAFSPLYYIGGGSAGWISKKIREAIPRHQGMLQKLSSIVLMMMGAKLFFLGSS